MFITTLSVFNQTRKQNEKVGFDAHPGFHRCKSLVTSRLVISNSVVSDLYSLFSDLIFIFIASK